MSKKSPEQETAQSHKIPTPKRDDFFGNLKKGHQACEINAPARRRSLENLARGLSLNPLRQSKDTCLSLKP